MTLSIGWRRTIKWGIRVLTALGIALGFLSLPPFAAGTIGILLLATTFCLERVTYYARVIHITPIPSEYVLQNKFASLWGRERYKDNDCIVFGQVFQTKRAAKEAYSLFRAWNLSDYIDRNGNIVLSIVKEKLDRFTILLYPGDRGAPEHAQYVTETQHGSNTESRVTIVLYYFATYADYWNRPEMKAVIEDLAASPCVLLNCYYTKDGELIPVAKRYLELSTVRTADREELPTGSLESLITWDGPWAGCDSDKRRKYESVIDNIEKRNSIETRSKILPS